MYIKIDLRGTYNLVYINEDDEWKASFRTHYGHFNYVVMPFDFINAPIVFPCSMNEFFVNTWMISLVVTLTTFSFSPRTWRNVNDMYDMFWTSLRKLDFMPSWKNANSFGTFLDMTFASKSCKVQTIMDWTTIALIYDALGFAYFYWHFITYYLMIVAPFTCLTLKNQPFTWWVEIETIF